MRFCSWIGGDVDLGVFVLLACNMSSDVYLLGPFCSNDLPADEQLLHAERLRFNGAQVLPLRDGTGGRATAYMLSPPVCRTAELDAHVNTLAAKVKQDASVLSPRSYHVVAFGSAGHAIAEGTGVNHTASACQHD